MAIPAWQRALMARSAGMNRRYGLGAAGQARVGPPGTQSSPRTGYVPPRAQTNDAGIQTNAPIPGVSAYGGVMAQAQNAYNNALAQIQARRTGALQSLGFDSSGNVQGLNPYGAYQQNRRYGAQAQEAITGANVSRGLGAYGGLAGRNREEAQYQTGLGLANVLGQAQGVSAEAAMQTQSAGDTLQERLINAQLEAARTNIEDRNFTTAPSPGAPRLGFKTPMMKKKPAASNAKKLASRMVGSPWLNQRIG